MKNKGNKLDNLTVEELNKKLKENEKIIIKEKFNLITNQIKDINVFKKIRKENAQIQTEITKRKQRK